MRPSCACSFALKNRGRRESRVPAAPAAPRAKSRKHASASPQVHRNTRPSLRNGFNGLFRALPGDRACLSPSPPRSLLPRNLTPASRRQDHTTSPSARSALRPRKMFAPRRLRPPHPLPYVRDDRETPLCAGRDGEGYAGDLRQKGMKIFLQGGTGQVASA
jgi:hypothetical protein